MPILASLKCLTSISALSDMTFSHEGNKTFIDRLVNFEKMVSLQGTYFTIAETVLNGTCLIFLVCFPENDCKHSQNHEILPESAIQ